MTGRLERFAGAHLRSAVERDVYLCLVLEPDRCWDADDLAAAIRHDTFDVDITLRRLHRAGAVEVCRSRREYRWHPRMSYLWSDAAHGQECPVCGMPIHGTGVRHAISTTTVVYCSYRCLVMQSAARGVPRTDRGA